MIKSLVTGGAGFIGSNLVDKLLSIGHSVVCVDNEFADNEMFYWNPDAINVKADITNYEEIKNLFNSVDYVFHMAAESRIGPAILNPIKAAEINILGTNIVLQCSRESNVKRVIYSSTSSGYGSNPIPNVETQPDDCLNPYSVSKISAEKICKMYSDMYKLPTIIFRYFNVYGERAPSRGQYAPVIGIFLRQKKAGQKLTVVGDGEQRRDFIYVGDVVEANIKAATKDIDKKFFGEVFNVGSGENISINEIAQMIDNNIEHIPPREGEARITLANIEKIRNLFDWSPKMNLKDWVKPYLI
ncbi:NAD-dependent epimerase/dehydratase family protein [Prochlorococcus marinus XMU1406]|uniref:NAD-dependent epimerase/dehydratase family protein n=1 Tax=Prochlorococcus marinus TaxID=1219 RepID=UPI001ADBC1A0|nr:NAD-dependent epimerase/dehydratase family protein [Prochlorococcus marinus]MBO8206813.1 NAD-dependent epimerase/dehydratase family protein [Prochlorococcus marinus XMU1406]MCR8542632.1 NAD-dependent epimerase/dehydratase family protein [Prochlorococcus marinus XMU1427]